jgi:hypothetical protein
LKSICRVSLETTVPAPQVLVAVLVVDDDDNDDEVDETPLEAAPS